MFSHYNTAAHYFFPRTTLKKKRKKKALNYKWDPFRKASNCFIAIESSKKWEREREAGTIGGGRELFMLYKIHLYHITANTTIPNPPPPPPPPPHESTSTKPSTHQYFATTPFFSQSISILSVVLSPIYQNEIR